MVGGRSANVLYIPCAEALLACCRTRSATRVGAEEHILELVHPGARKQKCWVVRGNQGIARKDGMTSLFKELEESFSNLIGLHAVLLFSFQYMLRLFWPLSSL